MLNKEAAPVSRSSMTDLFYCEVGLTIWLWAGLVRFVSSTGLVGYLLLVRYCAFLNPVYCDPLFINYWTNGSTIGSGAGVWAWVANDTLSSFLTSSVIKPNRKVLSQRSIWNASFHWSGRFVRDNYLVFERRSENERRKCMSLTKKLKKLSPLIYCYPYTFPSGKSFSSKRMSSCLMSGSTLCMYNENMWFFADVCVYIRDC